MDGMQKMQKHFSAGGEHAMESGQVDSGLRNQGSQPCYKVQWLEDLMGGAVSEGCFQLIAHLAAGRE